MSKVQSPRRAAASVPPPAADALIWMKLRRVGRPCAALSAAFRCFAIQAGEGLTAVNAAPAPLQN
jgi:hypothetical protein